MQNLLRIVREIKERRWRGKVGGGEEDKDRKLNYSKLLGGACFLFLIHYK